MTKKENVAIGIIILLVAVTTVAALWGWAGLAGAFVALFAIFLVISLFYEALPPQK